MIESRCNGGYNGKDGYGDSEGRGLKVAKVAIDVALLGRRLILQLHRHNTLVPA
jgi:hypothetical protein